MRRVRRSRIALCLTVIYALIIASPLAPLAMRSTVIAPVVAGECAGECSVCGCAPEQSANHTCCCAKKKELERIKSVDSGKNRIHILSCGCPCDDDDPPDLLDRDNSELLPYRFSGNILAYCEGNLTFIYSGRRTDRHGDPPDPPPRLILSS